MANGASRVAVEPLAKGWSLPLLRSSGLRDALLIAALATIAFVPGLGGTHLFDWDEINFAEAGREMLVSGDYGRVQVAFQPFAEKPPLFIWVEAISMRLLGVGEFAARLPNAVVGIVVLIGVYLLGRRLYDRRFGQWWALAFGGSILPNLYFRSSLIDPLFNLLIFGGVVMLAAYEHGREQKERWTTPGEPAGTLSHRLWRLLIGAGICVGLAVLTKGPVGLLLPSLTWGLVWLVRRRTIAAPIVPMGVFLAVVVAVAGPWYAFAATRGGEGFVSGFLARQLELLRRGVAGHSGPWYFHFVVLAVGCFPASLFALPSLRTDAGGSSRQRDMHLWMILLLLVVLLVFSVVRTKIVHYSSLAYFPLTFLAAETLSGSRPDSRLRGYGIGACALALLWAAALIAVPLARLQASRVAAYVRDPFVRATLGADAGWTQGDVLVGATYTAAALVVFWIVRQGNSRRAAAILFMATAAMMPLALGRLAPKMERYTQGPAITFYESLRGCDCYVVPLGFKSFAHLFYARVTPRRTSGAVGVPANQFEHWLLTGPIDRPAYFVSHVDKADRWRGRPGLRTLAERGGFVFFVRDATGLTR